MFSFIQLLSASLIGAMLGPYFQHFLTKGKSEEDKRIKHLEEVYVATNKITPYINEIRNNFVFMIAVFKGQIKIENVPKIQNEDPFPILCFLLDFHLNAPQELIETIQNSGQENICKYQVFIELIKNPQKVEDSELIKDLSEVINAAKNASLLQGQIMTWIKEQKSLIQNRATIFELSTSHF